MVLNYYLLKQKTVFRLVCRILNGLYLNTKRKKTGKSTVNCSLFLKPRNSPIYLIQTDCHRYYNKNKDFSSILLSSLHLS